jgi:hypothetical protein
MQMTEPATSPVSPAPAIAEMRAHLCNGVITDTVQFLPGLALHANPALNVGGVYRSPSGRLLELDVTTSGTGGWIALHASLEILALTDYRYIGLVCLCAAPKEQMIRACLRSGTDEGFVDCFFDKHILAGPEPRNHVDVLHTDTRRTLPEWAPWRELVLFLPTQNFRWDLHDLRPFVV